MQNCRIMYLSDTFVQYSQTQLLLGFSTRTCITGTLLHTPSRKASGSLSLHMVTRPGSMAASDVQFA